MEIPTCITFHQVLIMLTLTLPVAKLWENYASHSLYRAFLLPLNLDGRGCQNLLGGCKVHVRFFFRAEPTLSTHACHAAWHMVGTQSISPE